MISFGSWDRSVGIETGCGLDGRGSAEAQRPDRLWGPTQPHGYRGLSPRVKRPGREADQSNPFTAEVKNGGTIPPLPDVFTSIINRMAFLLTILTDDRFLGPVNIWHGVAVGKH
jgi:hypothetical protein